MKRFILSVSVVGIFAVYTFIKQDASASNKPSLSAPLHQQMPSPQPMMMMGQSGKFRDGVYTGDTVDAFYGYVQVQAVVDGGQLTDVKILQYPNDRRTSVEINGIAMPMLRQEAIQAQSAQIDVVSGASDSSSAFIESLRSALAKAS